MKRNIPVQLLEALENLISCCHSYVKWNNVWTSVLKINFGVRQGSVLSPFLFAVYLDDLSRLKSSVGLKQEAQLSPRNRAMLVCKVVEVWQDFLSEYVDKSSRTYATDD